MLRRRVLVAAIVTGWTALCSPVGHSLFAQAVAAAPPQTVAITDSARAFGQLVASLSEQGGYFNTDNLISNEMGYLHVMGVLDQLAVRGGAYIGVGPDQNFSYIARIRPNIAFIIDIRRDNLLQHLMFKALFTRARNRAEYLALWLGRPVPAGVERWNDRPLEQLVAWVDSTRSTPASAIVARAIVVDEARKSGVQLSQEDIATIQRFHSEFIQEGVALQFTTTGRAPQPYYPTLRQLLLAKDRSGQMANYLVREADFQYLRDMQRKNLIVPVVGDLSGRKALPAIGVLIAKRGERVSAFYVSNVEDYLMRDGTFPYYARTVASLPRDEHSVLIRSFFGGAHPASFAGSYATQLVQTLASFATEVVPAKLQYYRELVTYYVPFR